MVSYIYRRDDFKMNYIKDVKKVVVKVGSSSLTHNTGLLNLSAIDHLVRDLSNIHNRGISNKTKMHRKNILIICKNGIDMRADL